MKEKSVRLVVFGLVLLLLASGIGTVSAFSNSGDGDWKYYKEITVKDNSGKTLTDFQVLVDLNPSNFPANAKSDGSDLRFEDTNSKELSYWIEEWNYPNNAKIWVKVPSISASGETKIKMYYGNPSASAVSDGDKVFEFFDDFESYAIGSSLNGQGGWTVSGGRSEFTIQSDRVKSGSKSLRVKNVNKLSTYAIQPVSDITSKAFHFSVQNDVIVNDNHHYTRFLITQNEPQYESWKLGSYNGRYQYFQTVGTPDSVINIAPMSADTWYNIEIYKIGASKYRVKVNGKDKGEFDVLANPTNANYFCIADVCDNHADQEVAWWDDVRVHKYSPSEPTLTLSAEHPTTVPTPAPTPIDQTHIKFFVTPLGDNKYNITYTEYAPFTINVLRYSDGKGVADVPTYQLTPKKFTEGTKEYLQQNIAGIISTRLAEEALKQALIKVGKASITKVFIVGVAVQVIDYSIYMKTPYIDLKSTTEGKGKAVLYLPAKEYTMTVDVTDMLYPKQEPLDQTAYPTPEQIAEQLARIYLNTISKEYLQPIEYRDITLAIPTKLVLHEKGELTTEEGKEFEDYCKINAVNSKVVGYSEELTFWVEPWVIPPTTIGTGKVEEEKMLKAHVLSPERHFFPHVVSLSHYFQNKGLACSYIELISHLQDWGALNWPLESRWPASEDDFTVVIYSKEDKLKEYLTRKGMINQFSPKTVLQGEGWEVTKYTQTSADISGEHERFIFSIVVTDDEKREEAIKAFIENAYQLVGLPTEEENGIPGFEAVFAVLGLLVVAYVCGRRKK